MVYNIILNNGKTHKRDIPTSWPEVTFFQFLNLDSCGNDEVKVISLFTGIEYEDLKKAKIIGFDWLIEKLSFLKEKPEPVIPKTILGYPVPENLEFEQVQMFLDLKKYVAEANELAPLDKLKQYTMYCAVYACIPKFGEYDFKKAESFRDDFLYAPCTEVLGIGNFTLVKLIGLKMRIKVNSRTAISLTKRCKLALVAFRLRLAHYLQLLISRKPLPTK